jgi:hypothetical protein
LRAKAFSAGTDILQPTIAAGKGWNGFDLQVNISEQFSLGRTELRKISASPSSSTSWPNSSSGESFGLKSKPITHGGQMALTRAKANYF